MCAREKDNWSTRAVNVEGKYQTKEVWHDRDGKPLHPHTNYCVGGNTKFYGAALFRLRREDFCPMRHHGGISPAWPISYDELEPYYTQAEQHVPRARRARRGSDRPAGQRAVSASRGQPRAAHPATRATTSRRPACGRFTRRSACSWTRSNPHASKCIRCNTCDGFPCLVYAKSDAQVLGVDPALEYPNVGLMTNAYVERLETSDVGPRGDRRGGAAERRHRRLTRRTSSWSPAARSTPRRCCCGRRTTGIRAGWPTGRTWSAGTTWGTSIRS